MYHLKANTYKELRFLLSSFVFWRVSLFIFLFLSMHVLPLQKDFLGGGRSRYIVKPYLWSWLNFDGEHYLSIAKDGYKPLTHFYFPMYPMLVRNIVKPVGITDLKLAYTGLVLSNIFFLISIVLLFDLVRKDWNKEIAFSTVTLLLVFPASFYFASFYTESFFLFLSVLSFWSARQKNWLVAGIAGSLATATRVIGLILLPVILLEWWLSFKEKKEKHIGSFFYLFLIPLGIGAYMYFLWKETGDPLIFQHNIGIFGDQRSSSLVFIGRVFYRYLFKILPNLPMYWPVVFVTLLEFLSGLYFFMLSIFGFLKLRASYWLFLALGFLIPTFSGSFSSMSRYVIVLFPGFILSAVILQKLPLVVRSFVYVILYCALAIASSLFFRGFWVA